MRRTAASPVLLYALALSVTAAAVLVRWLLDPVLHNDVAFITLYGAIAIAVWAGGYRPALAAVVAGYLACNFLFVEPRGNFGTPSPRILVGLVLYLITCAVIIVFGEKLRAAERLAIAEAQEGRERAERLADAEARMRSLLDTLVDGIITIDERGVVQSFSRAAERHFGYAAAEVVGRNVSMLMPEPYHSAHDGYLANYVRTGEAKIIGIGREVVGRRKDGSTFPMDLAVGEFRAGGTRLFSGIVRDVTERTRAEDALRESEKNLRLALKAGRMGTWSWDVQTNAVTWSPDLEAIHGLTPGTFAGTFEAFKADIHPDDRDGVVRAIEQALASTHEHHLDYRIVWPDGTLHWLEAQGQLLADAAGAPVRMVGICRDITDRKTAEEALRQSEYTLQVIDRRKDEFLATLAHELRSGLTPLAIGAQLLRTAGGDPALLEQIRGAIDLQLKMMMRLVEDLQDVSRISEGKIELRRERVDLAAVLRNAVEIARPTLDLLEHRLIVTTPFEAVDLDADPVRMAQIFANLLNNAAKYSDQGGTIRLCATRDETDVMVSVADSGIGIAPEVLPRVFDMFMQDRDAAARARGGLGIGLTLAKRLVELHGGTIEARSEGPGKGSEFVVRLPIAPTPAATPH